MDLIYLCVGILIGLFIPSPIDGLIKGWASAIWSKIFGSSTKNTKGGCCS